MGATRSPRSIREVILQFEGLEKAVIDASSIIYMQKAGFLDAVSDLIELHTLPEILEESGGGAEKIRLIKRSFESPSNDQKLISCACTLELPIISEDRSILMAMKRKKRPYFNALMILNFLVYKKATGRDAYRRFLSELRDIAWYSREVWDFGESLFSALIPSPEQDGLD